MKLIKQKYLSIIQLRAMLIENSTQHTVSCNNFHFVFKFKLFYFSIYIKCTNMEGWVLKHYCCNTEIRTNTQHTYTHSHTNTQTHIYTLCQLHWTLIICFKMYSKRIEVNNLSTIQTMRDKCIYEILKLWKISCIAKKIPKITSS